MPVCGILTFLGGVTNGSFCRILGKTVFSLRNRPFS